MIEAHFIRNLQFGPPYISSDDYAMNLLTKKETPPPPFAQIMDTWPR